MCVYHSWMFCSVFLSLVIWAPDLWNEFLSLHFATFLQMRNYFWVFTCSASMSHQIPSMHLSVCSRSYSSSSSSLPCLKVNPSSSLCDVHQLLSMLPPVWLLPLFHAPVASLITCHFSAYMLSSPSSTHPFIPSCIKPPLIILPLETTSCVGELIDAPVCLDSL